MGSFHSAESRLTGITKQENRAKLFSAKLKISYKKVADLLEKAFYSKGSILFPFFSFSTAMLGREN